MLNCRGLFGRIENWKYEESWKGKGGMEKEENGRERGE
jgi:hypothetical protein